MQLAVFIMYLYGAGSSQHFFAALKPNAAERKQSVGDMLKVSQKKNELALVYIPMPRVDAIRSFLYKHGGSILA